jgi:hypothetical protein
MQEAMPLSGMVHESNCGNTQRVVRPTHDEPRLMQLQAALAGAAESWLI